MGFWLLFDFLPLLLEFLLAKFRNLEFCLGWFYCLEINKLVVDCAILILVVVQVVDWHIDI